MSEAIIDDGTVSTTPPFSFDELRMRMANQNKEAVRSNIETSWGNKLTAGQRKRFLRYAGLDESLALQSFERLTNEQKLRIRAAAREIAALSSPFVRAFQIIGLGA